MAAARSTNPFPAELVTRQLIIAAPLPLAPASAPDHRGVADAADNAQRSATAPPVALVHPAASLSYYGYSVDWTTLHLRMSDMPALFIRRGEIDAAFAAVGRDVEAACGAANAAGAFLTTIELDEPWTAIPLSDDASKLSVFRVAAATTSPLDEGRIYRFIKGPPGQLAVVQSVLKVLRTVESQLRSHGLKTTFILSSLAVVSDSFDAALHATARVMQSIRQIGFAVKGERSGFVPKPVMNTLPGPVIASSSSAALPATERGNHRWGTIDECEIADPKAALEFARGAYRSLLNDGATWGGRPWQEHGAGLHSMESAIAAATRTSSAVAAASDGSVPTSSGPVDPAAGAATAWTRSFQAYIECCQRAEGIWPRCLDSAAAASAMAAGTVALPPPGVYSDLEYRSFNRAVGALFDVLRAPLRTDA